MFIECTAACNISCFQACCAPETGITRTRQAGMLDVDLFKKVIDEAAPSLGAHRLLQLRRGVPPQARRRDVRVPQEPVPARLPLHEHERHGADRGAGAAARALRHRRGDVLDRRRAAGKLRAATGSAASSTSRCATFARWRTRNGAPAATCRASTGATSSSRGTTATRRWPRRGGWRRRSASTGCAGRSPTIPRMRSRAGSCQGHAGLRVDSPRDVGRQQPRQRHSRRDAARADRDRIAAARGARVSARGAGRAAA